MACYNLGDYICESRKQLGITQEELAFGICSTGTLSKIENGFVVPKRKIMKLLCSVLERQWVYAIFVQRRKKWNYMPICDSWCMQ